MKNSSIIQNRLFNQGLLKTRFTSPEAVTDFMGPVQGQDYYGTLWALGLRCGLDAAAVEKAINERKIVRSWPMRGTLHLVSSQDIRWILDITRPYNIRQLATLFRTSGLDEKILARCFKILDQLLGNGACLTREEIARELNKKKIATDNYRLSYFFYRAGVEKRICFGDRRGKQFTYTSMDSWIPPEATNLSKDEGLYLFAKKYFQARGPATLKDFMWWSSLPKTEATRAIEIIRPELIEDSYKGVAYFTPPFAETPASGKKSFLLPGFDEYLLGYTDRGAVMDVKFSAFLNQGNAMFLSTVVVNGKVVGSWRRTLKKDRVIVEVKPLEKKFPETQKAIIAREAKRYATFLGSKAQVVYP